MNRTTLIILIISLYIITIILSYTYIYNIQSFQNPFVCFSMQPPPEQDQNTQPQRNKQIIFIIAIYLLLTMSSHLTSSQTSAFSKNVISIINTPEGLNPPVKSIMALFTVQNYEGTWHSSNIQTLSILNNGQGKASMKFQKFGTPENTQYQYQFQLNNGHYIDDGDILVRCVINAEKLETFRNGTTILIIPKVQDVTILNQSSKNLPAFYRQENILKTVEEKIIEFNKFQLKLEYTAQTNQLSVVFKIQSQKQIEAQISILKEQSKMFSTILFAILLFIISYMQFTAIMEMLKAVFEGRQSAGNYSIITVLMATMWDAVICVVAFIEAFRNEESLILFIMPAFLLCLLFTNLQLRILLMIFQARTDNTNIREVMCKFNLVTYGGLILMYPLLIYTNLRAFFFIGISLIMIPQIYSNAINGHRPNFGSAYYMKFLSFRFLLIIYLKCFPWNIFELQPNYLLGFSCIALLTFQLFLLWMQKTYGPKKVLPRFLLPPVFNYSCEIEMNVQQGSQMVKMYTTQSQCAICLSPLISEPEPGAATLNVPFRVMKGPCGHKFHGACLGQWMQIKMQCPQCRSKLPPFQ